MYMWYVLVLFLMYFGHAVANKKSPPEVITPLGKIQGHWKKSFDGRLYSAFEGIPYAKPPIGQLRFEEPLPVEPWFGIWNATQNYRCIQNSADFRSDITGSEDCLYINVYIPDINEYLPVVVHIHAGGFMSGSGLDFLDPKYLMDRNFIIVTINYRLGPLGFLSTDDEVLPGNMGLKDQVLGLKWVQENIASFGGDPNCVTLTGFSAGAACAHFHYFSPLSKGLFHRGMSISGRATDPWAITERATDHAKKLAMLVGCPVSDTKELVDCLKNRPAVLLLDKTKYVPIFPPVPTTLFCPVVEKKSKNPFLPEHPLKLLKEKRFLDLPWITSGTRDEGLIISPMFLDKLKIIDERWEEVAPYVLHNEKLLDRKNYVNKLRKLYLGKEKGFVSNFNIFTKMLTDSIFITHAEFVAKLQSKVSKSPTYFYYFNYDKGENTLLDIYLPNQRLPGVSHGDDMIYLFGAAIRKKLSESDIKLKNACLDMLYNYAKNGIPSFKGIEWKPTRGEALTFLNITSFADMNLQTTAHLSSNSVNKFWDELRYLETAKEEL